MKMKMLFKKNRIRMTKRSYLSDFSYRKGSGQGRETVGDNEKTRTGFDKADGTHEILPSA